MTQPVADAYMSGSGSEQEPVVSPTNAPPQQLFCFNLFTQRSAVEVRVSTLGPPNSKSIGNLDNRAPERSIVIYGANFHLLNMFPVCGGCATLWDGQK